VIRSANQASTSVSIQATRRVPIRTGGGKSPFATWRHNVRFESDVRCNTSRSESRLIGLFEGIVHNPYVATGIADGPATG
jgi:hypothetical protein